MRCLCFFTFILMLSGCSPINEQMAEKKVIEFHDMYENKEYAKIYIQASDALKNSGSESGFISFLREAQKRDLGDFVKATIKTRKKIYHMIERNEILVVYNSEYTKRNVEEKFLFEIVGGEIKLKAYNYTSLN